MAEEEAKSAPEVAEVAPEVPEKAPEEPPVRPNEKEYNEKLQELNDRIAALEAKREATSSKISELLSKADTGNTEGADARKRFKEIRAEAQEIKQEKERLITRRKALREGEDRMSERAKSMRTDLRYTNLDQLDRKIGELEYKQATQSLSLAAEKALVKEVGELRKARSKVSEYHSLMEQSNKERDVSRATGRELSEQINVLGNKLKDVNARLNAQWEVMKAHDDQRDERRKGLPGLYKSRDETRASINAAYTELKALKNGFYQARKKYQAFAAKQRKERYEAQKKERADADKAERQERAKAEAEEAALHHPWEREIALCNVIENYLRSNKGLGPVEDFEAHDVKLAAGSSGDAGGEAAGGAGVATVTTSFDKAVKMTRKGQDEDDDEWAMLAASNAKKKGKKGRKAKKEDPAKKKLIHSLESMASFDLLGLAPPTTMKDVDASLTAVQEKRAAYRVAPPREKGKKGKKGGEAAAAPAPAPAAEASTE